MTGMTAGYGATEPDDDSSVLRRAAEQVVSRARQRGVAVQPHVGPDIQDADVTYVRRLRSAGAHFNWLALSVADVSMWDVHIGMVFIAPGTLSVGVHILDHVADELRAAAEHVGGGWASMTYSAPVGEHQFNRIYPVPDRAAEQQSWEAAVTLCVQLDRALTTSHQPDRRRKGLT